MQKLFSSGTNKKVTGKAADSGYNATKTTTPKPQVQLPNLQNLFQSNTSGTGRQVTGKAADARPQVGVQSTSSLPRVQMPSLQTTSQNLGAIGTTKQVTGKAADSGYTPAKKQASQAANRQTVQNALQPITFGAANQNTGKAADSGITTELRRAQQQANRQTVGNLFQGTQSDYSLAKGTAGALQKGLQQIAEAGGNTFAFAEDAVLAPLELAFGRDLGEFSDNAPLNRWAQKIREEGDAVNAYYADNIKAGGKAAELYDYFGSSLIAAIPMAAAAFYSAGTPAVATPASLQAQAAGALSPGLTQTVRDVARGVTKDPQYWLSLFQMVGNNYENAISDMEQQNAIAQQSGGKTMDSNSIRTKAALQAMGSGLMDAGIEVGGGLQTLPKELRQGGNVWKALANSGIGEGKEEVFQGIVDRASQNLVYDKGNPLISLTDPNAVFSLPAAANEFTEGFTVGSILGGGQAGVLSAAQAIQSSPITSYADAFRRLIGMKTESTAASETTRYQELERKYLDGSISPDEADELWRLERLRSQTEIRRKSAERTDISTYERYREQERKFLDGSISEQDGDELRKLDNFLDQELGRQKNLKEKGLKRFTGGDIMLAGGVLDNFDRKSALTGSDEDLALVNPSYFTKEFEWQNNCQRCVSAYEMRRRGFDVTAKPLPTKNLADDPLAKNAEHAWKNAVRRWCLKENGRAQVEEFMKNWGDGARAIVGVGFSGRFGHVFIAEQRNGRTIYIDPQNGSVDCSSYFEYAVKGQTYIARIDTLTPTDAILDCCKNRR